VTDGERRHPELLAIVVAAVLLRLPIALSRSPLTYDDGVYLASAGALRAGDLPFRDVFSSQGPAFLPLLWVADALGLRTLWSPRLLPLLAGVVLVVVVHRLARRLGDRWGAALAALVVATSGCVMFTTDRIESDAVTAAVAAVAVLVASGAPSRRRYVATTVLLGVALAVKSLFAGPAVLAALWLVGRRGGWRTALVVGAGAIATVVALALPWGLAGVWDQYVHLHLLGRADADTSGNGRLAREVLRSYDRVLEWLGLAALLAVVWRWVARRPSLPRTERDLAVAVWIWFGAALLVVPIHAPLFLQHLTMLIPPATLLVARYRPPLVAVVAVLVLALPGQAERVGWRRTSPPPTQQERSAIELLRTIEPRSAKVISDEPALPWLAGRTSPGSMVDLSFVRIDAGDLTTADVVVAANHADVCAVLLWSNRLAQLPGLRRALHEYEPVFRDGDHELLLREGCDVRPATAP